ncbi:T9SS type A sorting domain-containing protein [bacterium]|nr:T9SS type A sorting domain-containing protein [bacterium]
MRNMSWISIMLVVISLVALGSTAQATWTKHSVVTGWNGLRGTYADDIDGDGDIDLMAAARYVNTIAWFENTPGGFVTHILSEDFEGSWDVNTCDIDGDGMVDILGAALSNFDIAVWRNNGTTENWQEYIVDYNCQYAKSVFGDDLDGDGDGDVISASFGNDYMNWYRNIGSDWQEHLLQANFNGARDIVTTDFDHDGDIDILGAGDNTGAAIWWNIDNNGTFEYELIRPVYGIRSINHGDITGDGIDEVIASTSYFDAIVYWEKVDTGWVETVVTDTLNFANYAYIADIDNDGQNDIVGCSYDDDLILWWEQDNGSWTEHVVGMAFDGPRTAIAADVDGDGDDDIIGAASHTGELAWWENEIAFRAADIDIVPHDPLFQIPAAGGTISYDAYVTNNQQTHLGIGVWTEVRLPNGNYYGPLVQTFVVFPPNTTVTVNGLSQYIPDYAPSGYYQYLVKLGGSGTGYTLCADSFTFRKLNFAPGEVPTPGEGWGAADAYRSGIIGSVDLPETYEMEAAYPNPFNPSTTVAVSLPEASELTVSVFNVTGQQVAELANGQFTAGQHNLTFDAQGLASGLYFIHATVPGQLNQVQKVMLVR